MLRIFTRTARFLLFTGDALTIVLRKLAQVILLIRIIVLVLD